MARKIYKTRPDIISFSTGLVIQGRKEKVYITFTGGVHHPKFIPSVHIEDDPVIQKALEALPLFGRAFMLAYTFGKDPVKETQPVDDKLRKIHQVTTIQQAITNLIKNGYDGDMDSLVDIDSIQAAAKTIGVVYTKLA